MSSFALKTIALFLMLLDHLYQFLGFTGMVPIWFTWLGRLSAPIFCFCAAEYMTAMEDPGGMRRDIRVRRLGRCPCLKVSQMEPADGLPAPFDICFGINPSDFLR